MFTATLTARGFDGAAAPAEFLILPYGLLDAPEPAAGAPVRTHFSRDNAAALVSWFKQRGRDLVIDFEHQTMPELNTRPDGLAPAAGWVGALEARADGLWATAVRWTAQARDMIAQGAYRYFSPVLAFADKARTRLAALGPIALTNDPALTGIVPLVAKAGREGTVQSVLRAGEPAGADEIRWRAEYANSAALRQEFTSEVNYVAYRQGVAEGTIVESRRAGHVTDEEAAATVAALRAHRLYEGIGRLAARRDRAAGDAYMRALGRLTPAERRAVYAASEDLRREFSDPGLFEVFVTQVV